MTTTPIISRTQRELRGQLAEWRGSGDRIAFVPTMGALHEGHLSLVRLARKKAERVIVSIFVNPTQFAPGEDLEAYPRTEAADSEKLAAEGVDLIYIPLPNSMYNAHHATAIKVGGVATGLETDHRPTFFDGVALVVTKLFNRVQPDVAIFGEKDYQQLATIRRLVEDLDMPIHIIGAPIARDEYGLALSSRNQYFNAQSLAKARQLNTIMFDCAESMERGANVDRAAEDAAQALLDAGFSGVDYVQVRSKNSLTVLEGGVLNKPARLLIAAHCDGVRLIDNCAVNVKK
ncbi:pantothenate synthetase [Litorimonas taeanensis]|uniref:Pantothenate synthetase n=1 Tax=Litorimonas taeanensis TaxID=568099 RepID=A0A420WMD0_9PROT|nr:pantoate--beta-alanine ligase [Litorimonas taeanensis]RKQ72056.1 pantothenate synthetase [Litorimonas taeanensis]